MKGIWNEKYNDNYQNQKYMDEYYNGEDTYYRGGYSTPTSTDKDSWTNETVKTKSSCITECPELKTNEKIKIFFSEKAYESIRSYCALLPNIEWCAGLKGIKKENGDYEISDLIFPEQEGAAAHIEVSDNGARELHQEKEIIGWLHSHNTMAAFFSGEDLENASDFQISVTVNNDLDTASKVRIQLSCGRTTLVDAEAVFMVEEEEIKDEYKEIVTAKFKERQYSYKSYGRYGKNEYEYKKENVSDGTFGASLAEENKKLKDIMLGKLKDAKLLPDLYDYCALCNKPFVSNGPRDLMCKECADNARKQGEEIDNNETKKMNEQHDMYCG